MIWKINASIWFHCMKKRMSNLFEDKRKDKATEGTHSLEPHKGHTIGEFVIVA